MKRNLRILGLVACLLTIWMVTRGTNGCMVVPDMTATLTIDGDATSDPEQANAAVYGSGKLKNKNANATNGNLGPNGDATIELKWYKVVQGDSLEGMVTIVSTKGNNGAKKNPKHIHQYYSVTNGGSDTIDITDKKLKH